MKLRPSIARLALALLLLLTQQLGMMHAVSHLSADTPASEANKKQLPGELQCKHCLAFACIGSPLAGSSLTLFAGPGTGHVAAAVPAAKLLPAALRAFDSRAPPALV